MAKLGDVIDRGALASRPAAGIEGRLYFDTDNSILYRDNGADWESVEGDTDPDAVHDNVSGEIAAVTEKTAPVAADLVLLEDSEDSNDKKRAQIGNLVQTVLGARVYKDAAQAISNATWTAIEFNQERFDSGGFHDNATNNTRLTVPAGKGGKYLIIGHIQFELNDTGGRYAQFLLNGTTRIGEVAASTITGTNNPRLSWSTIYDLAAADYVELRVYQNSGNALDVQVLANVSPEFMMVRLGV